MKVAGKQMEIKSIILREVTQTQAHTQNTRIFSLIFEYQPIIFVYI